MNLSDSWLSHHSVIYFLMMLHLCTRSGLPSSWRIFICALSTLTPDSPAFALIHFFNADFSFILSEGLTTTTWCNEARFGSFPMAHIFAPQGFIFWITPNMLISLPATWTIRRVNTFQLTRFAKLVLAHRSTQSIRREHKGRKNLCAHFDKASTRYRPTAKLCTALWKNSLISMVKILGG